MVGRPPGPKKIIMKSHVSWGHASAHQFERVLVDSDGRDMHSVDCVDEVSERCDVRRSYEKAPHVPIAETSTVSMFNEKLRPDLAFLGDLIALHAVDVFSKFSLLIPVRSMCHQEVRDAICGAQIGVFVQPKSIQMDEGGGWGNEVWPDFRS